MAEAMHQSIRFRIWREIWRETENTLRPLIMAGNRMAENRMKYGVQILAGAAENKIRSYWRT